MAESASPGAAAASETAARPASTRRQLAFRTLGIPAFRLLLVAELFDFMAINARLIGQGWVIVELTDSDAWVGLVAGLPAIPVIALALVGGVLTDRFDRRLLQVSIFLSLSAIGFLTAILISTDTLRLWHLVVLAFPVAFLSTMRMTAGVTMTVDVVGRERIFGANAVITAVTNLGRFVGPGVGGFLIGQFGTGSVFYAIGAMLLLASGAMWFLRVEASSAPNRSNSMLSDLKAGLKYIGATPELRWLGVLALSLITAGMSMPIIPRWTRDVLDAGPEGFGIVLAAGGVGGLVGAFSLMASGQVRNLARTLVIVAGLWSAAIVAFAFSSSLPVSAFMFGVTGAAVAWWANTLRTMFQLAARDDMRGRVMSLFGLVSQMLALGWLIGGLVSEAIGPRQTLILAGVTVFVLYLFAYLRSAELRQIGK